MADVIYTPLAEQDLRSIARYLAEKSQSLAVAYRFLDSIDAKSAQYAAAPKLAEECPELATGVRRFAVGSYVVFYRESPRGIEVLRVLHGSRDLPNVWRRK